MEKREFQKRIVLLLLLNKNGAFLNAYNLIKSLSRWFNIIDFNDLMREIIHDGFVIKKLNGQEGEYVITDIGFQKFKQEQSLFEEELIKSYPEQSKIINTLLVSARL